MNERGMEPGTIDTNYKPEAPVEVLANHRGIVPGAEGLEKPVVTETPVAPEETRMAAEDTRSRSSDQADTPPATETPKKTYSSTRGRSGRSRK